MQKVKNVRNCKECKDVIIITDYTEMDGYAIKVVT